MSSFEESWRSASTAVQDKEERKILFATLDSFRSVSVFFYGVPLFGRHNMACAPSKFLLGTHAMVMRPHDVFVSSYLLGALI